MNWWLQAKRRWWERKGQLVREDEKKNKEQTGEIAIHLTENWFKMPSTRTEGFCLWKDGRQIHTECPRDVLAMTRTSPWGSWFKLFSTPAVGLLWLCMASLKCLPRVSTALQVELWTSALRTNIFFRIVKNHIPRKNRTLWKQAPPDIVPCGNEEISEQSQIKCKRCFIPRYFIICHFLRLKQMGDAVCTIMFHHSHST